MDCKLCSNGFPVSVAIPIRRTKNGLYTIRLTANSIEELEKKKEEFFKKNKEILNKIYLDLEKVI